MASGFRVRTSRLPAAGTRGVRGQVGTQAAMTTPGAASLDIGDWVFFGQPSPASRQNHIGARGKLPTADVRGQRIPMPPSAWPYNSPAVESQLPGFTQESDSTPFIRVVTTPSDLVALQKRTAPPGTRPIETGKCCNTTFGGK